MYVFNYDPATGAYTGGTPCEFCQRKPGDVLVPAWATKTPPPRDWDNAVNWPHYLAETDGWELRPLPATVVDPTPDPAPPIEPLAELEARAEAHLLEAQRLLGELKDRAGDGA